jgi:hypothetical protein
MVAWGKRKTKSDVAEPLRCSFCDKTSAQVRKLIAGPEVYICDECVQVCVEIIEEGARLQSAPEASSVAEAEAAVAGTPGSSTVWCSLCGSPAQLEDALAVPSRGFLCAGCTDVIEVAVAERRPPL